MKKEHAVSVSLTNGTECICNPDIVLGDKYGLWDLDNEISPIGTLLDLNAAWELFISRKKFENISYKVTENSEGDKTYTLVDDNGNPTKAIFTIKNADEQIVDIQWQDGNLYIFYNRKRPINSEEEQGLVPVKPVLDEQGNPVYDEETCGSFGRRSKVRDEVLALNLETLLPSVKITGDKAILEYAYWNDWRGMVKSTVEVVKDGDSVKFSKPENKVLVAYDCGIMF